MRGDVVRHFLLCALVGVACSNETDPDPTERSDATPGHPDATRLDLIDGGEVADGGGPMVDSGRPDAGFRDPDTLLRGKHRVNGLDTYLVMLGTLTSTSPPAILLHSGPAISHEYLLPHMKLIGTDRLLVFYDMRATGRSSYGTLGTSTITAAQHALDLHDLIEWIGTYANTDVVDLVGHGYGAGIAALYTAQHKERVNRLVLTTPYPAQQDQVVAGLQESSRRLTSADRNRISAIRNRPECIRNIESCFLQIWAVTGPKTMCSTNRERFTELNFEYASFRAQYFVETQLRDSDFDWRPVFKTITATTTIISGSCDTIPAEAAQDYAASIGGSAHHVLDDSGHFPMVESPARYRALVRAALSD